jgi:uncharacterized repeat protein (TIGR02543 family)
MNGKDKIITAAMSTLLAVGSIAEVFGAYPVSDGNITPVPVDGNDGKLPEFAVKYTPNGNIDDGELPDGFVINHDVNDDGTTVAWSISGDDYVITSVFVKAGSGGHMYYYGPNFTSDSGLVGLLNEDGTPKEISHVTYHYEPVEPVTEFTLTTIANAGGIVSPGGTFNSGATPTVTATPATGYQFSGWTGDVPAGQENNPTITITMDADKTVTASFTEIVVNPITYILTTNANAGGTVSAGGTFNSGATPTVTATPAPGYQFSGWTGDVPLGQQNNASFTITMDANKSVTASFTEVIGNPITYILTTNANAGGTVSAGGTFNSGATPTVTATAAPGYQFSGWTGDVPAGQQNNASFTITMDANKQVTASFTEIVVNPITYILTTNANAGGTVSAGGTFNSGATPTVTATAATGFQFNGWAGDVPTGQQNNPTITILMDANKTVTASFSVIPQDNDDNDDNDDEDQVVVVVDEETPAGPVVLEEVVPEVVIPEVVVIDEETPAAPVTPEEVIPDVEIIDEETPAGPATLPKTGGVPSEALFGLGGLTTLIGAALKKFRK